MAQTMIERISLDSIAPINTISNNIGLTRDDTARSHSSTRFHLELGEQAISRDAMEISRGRAAVIIGLLFGTTIVGSFSTGLLTVGLPRMAADLKLADNLLLWYGRITTTSFRAGKRRNLGLSFMGAGQPIGFFIGLVLGGVFVDTIGWRAGYYICAGANLLFCAISLWGLPSDRVPPVTWARLQSDIDWIGALIASSSLGLLSYVLATITGHLSHIRDASTIALLSISMALIPLFVFWIGRQEKNNKPALIPNSLWKSPTFSSICITVLLSWAVFNGMEWFCSLFFQDVQKLSALDTSLRFIPSIISGAIINISIGVFIQRLRVDYLIFITSIIAAASPLLMALTNPAWPYWYTVFWAMLLGPFSADGNSSISL
ncbi:hypothetical protein Q9189_007190 [Teloschistes chrysophthalmus]